jgi:ABC-2 type transport system permease protein
MPAADARRRPPVVSFVAFELRRVLRTATFLIWTLAFPVVFYLSSYDNPTNNAGNTRSWGTPWPVYFMVSMCAWAAIAAAFNAGGGRLAAERTSGWTRQLRLTPLPPWAYATGKVLIGVGLALAAAVVLALVAAGAARPDLPAAAWAEVIAACWLGSLPFAGLGILLGLITSSSSAQPVMIATMLVLNVLGGLLPLAFPALPQMWVGDCCAAAECRWLPVRCGHAESAWPW